MESELRDASGEIGFVGWRCEQLARSGFPPVLTARVAGDSRFDLHALVGLAEHGCPPELAVRILAPLEADGDGA